MSSQLASVMVFRVCRRPAVLAAILLAPVALAACGESSEEKATAQVCSSTKAIQAELSKLSGLSISTKAPEEIKAAATAMGKEVAKIKESTGNLAAASKAPVQTAQTALQAELAGLAKTLVSTARSSGNIEAVLKQSEPQVKTAIAGLTASYKQAYESLKCS